MRRITISGLILAVFITGVSGYSGTALAGRTSIKSIDSMELVMRETPKIEIATLGGLIMQSLGGLLTAPVGVAVNKNNEKKVKEGVEILDFGVLVMKLFSERAGKEIPDWPKTSIREEPVGRRYKSGTGHHIEFTVDKWGVAGKYFYALTIATMKNSKGRRVWAKKFSYHSSSYRRGMKLKQYMAEDGKLLKEEIAHAADLTVAHFIKSLKRMR